MISDPEEQITPLSEFDSVDPNEWKERGKLVAKAMLTSGNPLMQSYAEGLGTAGRFSRLGSNLLLVGFGLGLLVGALIATLLSHWF